MYYHVPKSVVGL